MAEAKALTEADEKAEAEARTLGTFAAIFDFYAGPLKYGSEEKGSSLCRCSILLGFIMSKNLRGL